MVARDRLGWSITYATSECESDARAYVESDAFADAESVHIDVYVCVFIRALHGIRVRGEVCSAVCYRLSLRRGDGGRCAGANASSYAFADAVTNIFADWHSHGITYVVTDAFPDAVVRREGDGSGTRGLYAEWWLRFARGLQLQRVGCAWI